MYSPASGYELISSEPACNGSLFIAARRTSTALAVTSRVLSKLTVVIAHDNDVHTLFDVLRQAVVVSIAMSCFRRVQKLILGQSASQTALKVCTCGTSGSLVDMVAWPLLKWSMESANNRDILLRTSVLYIAVEILGPVNICSLGYESLCIVRDFQTLLLSATFWTFSTSSMNIRSLFKGPFVNGTNYRDWCRFDAKNS